MAKLDAPERGQVGGYRVKPVLERLRDKPWLDSSSFVRHNMHAAGEHLAALHIAAGLSGSIGGIDMDRIQSSSNDPAHMMPITARMAEARIEFRRACATMGYQAHLPFYGAARVTVALVCEDRSFDDVAADVALVPGGHYLERRGAVKEKLRSGLASLVVLWHIGVPMRNIRAMFA